MTRTQLPGGGGLSSLAILAATLLGLAALWLPTLPPMVDLPQHGAQIVMLQELLRGQSRWASLLQLNLFTPYWLAYLPALLLAPLAGVLPALLLVLSASLLASLLGFSALRRQLQAPAALDILIIPAFFGFSWHWGFYNFLVALPLGLWLLRLCLQQAQAPSRRTGLAIMLASLLLLATHGLMFLFMAGLGALLIFFHQCGHWRQLFGSALWFMPAALLLLAYGTSRILAPFQLQYFMPPVEQPPRLLGLAAYSYAGNLQPIALAVFALGLLGLLAARLWQGRDRLYAYIPLAYLLLFCLLVPDYMQGTVFFYQRFCFLLLPFLALALSAAALAQRPQARLLLALVSLSCLTQMGQTLWHTLAFERESHDFRTVLASAAPGERALGLVADRASAAAANSNAYLQMPAWYQALQGGLVDFNFAYLPLQPVVYRQAALPKFNGYHLWGMQPFDWVAQNGQLYRYYFVRTTTPAQLALLEAQFSRSLCPVTLQAHSGSWRLYEQATCTATNR